MGGVGCGGCEGYEAGVSEVFGGGLKGGVLRGAAKAVATTRGRRWASGWGRQRRGWWQRAGQVRRGRLVQA